LASFVFCRKRRMKMKLENVSCSCKRIKCKRHSNCEECIAYHRNNKKHPLPFCKKTEMQDAEKIKE